MRVFILPIMGIFYGYPLGMGKLPSLTIHISHLSIAIKLFERVFSSKHTEMKNESKTI
jgi:hypothetical protein